MSEFGTETNPYGSFMTEPAVPEGTSARAGAKLVEGHQKAPDKGFLLSTGVFCLVDNLNGPRAHFFLRQLEWATI